MSKNLFSGWTYKAEYDFKKKDNSTIDYYFDGFTQYNVCFSPNNDWLTLRSGQSSHGYLVPCQGWEVAWTMLAPQAALQEQQWHKDHDLVHSWVYCPEKDRICLGAVTLTQQDHIFSPQDIRSNSILIQRDFFNIFLDSLQTIKEIHLGHTSPILRHGEAVPLTTTLLSRRQTPAVDLDYC